MSKSGSIRNFRANFQPLGFRSPRWFKVDRNLFNPAKWSRFRMRHFHDLVERFKKK